MSSLATIVKDESLSSTLRIGLYSLGACSVVGLAAYIGYKAARPNQEYLLRNRHPESNDQVNNKGISQTSSCVIEEENAIEQTYTASA